MDASEYGPKPYGFTPEDISTADIDRLCLGLAEHWRQTSMEMVQAATKAGERKGNSENRCSILSR